MEENQLKDSERVFLEQRDLFNFKEATKFLHERDIGIVIILDFVKAQDWPYKGRPFVNEPINKIPIIWAIFSAPDKNNITMTWNIHPGKCFPKRYNQDNPNSKKSLVPVVQENNITLGGCARTLVTISGRRYEVYEKTAEYCSIFGIPDDCFDPNFEREMLDRLTNCPSKNLWCFEKTVYEPVPQTSSLRFQAQAMWCRSHSSVLSLGFGPPC